jgi:hypothetical protein
MSWEQMLEILAVNSQEYEDYMSQPPVACPNDGWPLESGPDGELHCKFDGYTYEG